MIRTLIKLVFLLLIVVIVGGVVFVIYVDQIAQQAVEKGGSFALGVDTTVKSADVEILSGQFSMRDLNVANPAGFDGPHFIDLKNAEVEVSLGTLMQDVVNLSQLKFTRLDLNLQKVGEKTNYGVILENLKRFESADEKAPAEDGGKRFIVDKIVLRDVEVHADLAPVGGDLTKVDLPLDRIVLKDVGKKEGGLTIPQLFKVIVQAMMDEIVERGGNILSAELIGDLKSHLAELTDLSSLGIDVESTLPENIGEVLKNQGINIPDLGNILSGDEKKDANDSDGK